MTFPGNHKVAAHKNFITRKETNILLALNFCTFSYLKHRKRGWGKNET